MKKMMNNLQKFLFLMALGLSWTLQAHGQTASHRISDTGKNAAPNLEDNANYFSENRRGVSAKDLMRADALRMKTIYSITEILETKKKSLSRFELLLRLGELRVERHDYLRDYEMETYGRAWDLWSKNGKKTPEPKLDTSRSEAEMALGVDAFRRLVSEFPKHPRTDAALYALGKTLARMGKDTAVDYFNQLTSTFPSSPLVPETYLALGEWYFEKNQVNMAVENYKKALDYKNHPVYPYAVYKLGWAYYNLAAKYENSSQENYKKAITAFKLVIKLADKDKGKTRNFDLRDEAIHDLIMVWAETEDVNSAWRYFKTIGQQESFYKMLAKLGHAYQEQGKNSQAIAVYQRLIRESPLRDANPETHAKLVELYDLVNNIPAVVVEIGKMNKLYLPKDAPWVQDHEKNKEILAEASRIVELNTHRYGAIFHQRGQKSKSPQYMRFAADIYEVYLASFARNPNAYEIRYFLAEILYDFKKYELSSFHYLKVAKDDPKGKYLKPAALNAVGAMNQLVSSQSWPKLPPPGQVPQPIEIPSPKKKLIQTIDQYVTLLPGEKEGDPMRFTAAQTYFDYGQYKEALSRFETITKVIPTTKQAKASVKIILGYYSEKENWNSLISWSRKFSKQEKLLDAEMKKLVVDVLRSAMFKQALAFEKVGQFQRSAEAFLVYQKEFPSDPSADRAVYNALLNYYKITKIDEALKAGNLLLAQYPKSQVVPDTIISNATSYETLAKFDSAADLYKRFAIDFPRDPRAPGALFNAGVLYKGLKRYEDTVWVLQRFAERYSAHPIAPDACIELARLFEKQQHFVEASRVYAQYASLYRQDQEQNLFARAKAAVLKMSYNNRNSGLREIEQLRRELSQKDAPTAYEARSTIAEAIFKIADSGFADFLNIKINDGNNLEKQITLKQKHLEALAARYEDIFNLGSAEYTVAALYRLGEAHENFATALFNAPGPRGIAQNELNALKTELEKIAFPLKNEAYKFFETAYKRSREVETFTVWTQRTYQKMVEIAPQKNPEIDEISADPKYLTHRLGISKQLAELMVE